MVAIKNEKRAEFIKSLEKSHYFALGVNRINKGIRQINYEMLFTNLKPFNFYMCKNTIKKIKQDFKIYPAYYVNSKKSQKNVNNETICAVKEHELNKLNREFKPSKINTEWVMGVTELNARNSTNHGYRSSIQDLFDRKIRKTSYSKLQNSNFIINTIKKAIERVRKSTGKWNGVTIHLDQAPVHTSTATRKFCKKNNVILDFSRPGTPLDNSVKESEHSRFKCEFFYPHCKNKNWEETVKLAKEWDDYYNTKRIRL